MKHLFTITRAVRINTYLKFFPLLTLFFFAFNTTKAQSSNITLTVAKAPCNNDGILVAQTSGVTPPYILSWYLGSSVKTDTVNGPNDTLFNYSGEAIYVSGYATGWQGFGTFKGAPPFNYSVNNHAAVCPALGSLAVTVTGGKAPYNIQWYTLDTKILVGTGDSVNLPSGGYSVVITDNNGCVYGSYVGYDSIFIYGMAPFTYNVNTTQANCTNGTAAVRDLTGGKPPYAFQWSNGANTDSINSLVTGTYNITVTDAQGCQGVNYAYVYQAYQMSAVVTPTPATCLQSDGSAIAFGNGGQPPYVYQWSTGQNTQSVSGLTGSSAGTYYSVNVTDSKGCIGSGWTLISSSTPITVNYSSTASSCTAATGTAALNISGGTAPYVITWNTFPAQSSTTATGLTSGLYGFLVTDAVGCVRSGSVYVPPISVISASLSATNALCTQSNGSVTAVVTSGANPISYLWSNGATDASINGLAAGGYALTITDNMSCVVNKYAYVGVTSPISLSFNATQASCLYATDGSISANVSGGTSPYNYSWSNGQTTAAITGVPQGYYFAYISDASGCTQDGYSYVPYDPTNNDCYCTISGTVFDDLNNNCTLDNGEPGIQNIMVHLNGFGYTFTDANGNYSFQAPSGTYTLSEDVEYYYPLASCQSNSISVPVSASSGCIITNNFANVVNPIHDVAVLTTGYCPPPRPGFNYTQRVIVSNNGTVTENNIHASYANDGQLSLGGFTPSLFTSLGGNYYNIVSGFPSLAPGASQEIDVSYNVPTNIPIGTSVTYNDTVAYDTIPNWVNDYSPWNNVSAYQNTVVGSFDPNYKEVTPKGTGAQGLITSKDSMLTYTIHFQNTGNYPAQKVVVVDTLDSHLDITTLRPGYSNFNYATAVNEKGVLKFTFNNINLPDSSGNQNASVGMVSYTIRQKKSNSPGTKIQSPASIYFDYNSPVKTNTTLNTLYDVNGIKPVNQNVFEFAIYPNPASTGKVGLLINTDISNPSSTIGIYNLVGQLVQSQTVGLNKGRNVVNADISTLPAGFYFVRVDEGENSLIQKLTVIK